MYNILRLLVHFWEHFNKYYMYIRLLFTDIKALFLTFFMSLFGVKFDFFLLLQINEFYQSHQIKYNYSQKQNNKKNGIESYIQC